MNFGNQERCKLHFILFGLLAEGLPPIRTQLNIHS